MIRLATKEDFDAILDLSAEFWQFTMFDEPFEREHCRTFVEMAYNHNLLCVVDIGGVVGFCAGVKSPSIGSSKAIVGTELAWYLRPDHRGGKSGVALLKFMEQLAESQGVKYWTMVYMQTSMPETVGRMYERMGYEVAEVSYTKVLHGSNNVSGNSCSGDSVCGQ